MQKRVLEYIQEYQMIQEHDRVVVGVSGGADSICLFYMLLEIQKKIPFQIGVVHVNHNLRGAEAREDAAFVEALCDKHRISYEVFSFDVMRIAAEEKLTVEEAGRQVRYQAFEEFARKWQGNKIALAHHKNDLAETMIHNLVRGSGIAGLCSIHSVRNQYIRPLLCMNRAEVEQYLKEEHFSWRTDSTNLEDHYMRNRIRHQVVEYLVREVNPKAVEHMVDTADSLYEAQMYLDGQALQKMKQYVWWEGEKIFVSQTLLEEPSIMQKYIFGHCFEEISGTRKDMGREHLDMMCRLMKKEVGKCIDLPGGITARRTYEGVVLEKKVLIEGKMKTICLDVNIDGITEEDGYSLKCQVRNKMEEKIPEKTYTKWLDYDKIKDVLVLRSRKTGDYITTCASGGTKKLKDYFIDEKIPKEERDHVLLLAEGSEILWVIGHRISEKYKVDQDTERILLVQIKGRNIHE